MWLGRRSARAGAARAHGTYVAGILSARRDSAAPAICPGCTLLVRPIFLEPAPDNADTPSASPGELADAIVDCVEAGAWILNLSVALATPSPNREAKLEQALDHAAARGTMVVAAAGNQGTVGGSAITRHPWVIPVVACDPQGRPMAISNLGSSIARRGLMAPGDAITSLGTDGPPVTSGGTSAAVPFVTGTMALLWSLFPEASTAEVEVAVTQSRSAQSRRRAAPARRLGCLPADAEPTSTRMIDMAERKKASAGETKQQEERQPYRVRLPGFVKDEQIGLGDVIKRATYSLGIRPCGGCGQRAAALNRWVVFTR